MCPTVRVATVLTVYGIETFRHPRCVFDNIFLLQQYLPFTVLKQVINLRILEHICLSCNSTYRLRYWNLLEFHKYIESRRTCCNSTYRLRYWNIRATCNRYSPFLKLQQYLPFTVLKRLSVSFWMSIMLSCNSTYRLRYWNFSPGGGLISSNELQQYLPFTVLKQVRFLIISLNSLVATVLTVYGIETECYEVLYTHNTSLVATVLTVYGIETIKSSRWRFKFILGCNSTYRLRYWNGYYLQYI